MTSLGSVEVNIIQQAIITGQVINGLTSQGMNNAFSVEFSLRLPGDSEFQPLRANNKTTAGGYFVLSGNPLDILPANLMPADTVDFRITVSAPGFNGAEEIVTINATDITASPVSIDIAGNNFELSLIDAPLVQRVISLLPEAVGINGIVVDDHDLDSPVVGASVQVIAPAVLPAVTSDSNGRYRIENLPVVESITVRAELGSASSNVEHVIDYTTPFNIQLISLNG